MKEISHHLGEMKEFHLNYFEITKKSYELVEFLQKISDNDFDNITKTLTSNMEKEDFSSQLLTNITHVKKLLYPIISFQRNKAPLSLIEFCKTIKESLPDTEDKTKLALDRIEEINHQLQYIKNIFSSAGGIVSLELILPIIRDVLEHGELFHYFSNHPQGPDWKIIYRDFNNKKIILSQEKIQDIIRGINIFINKNKWENILDTFNEIYQLCKSIYRYLLDLELTGHPDYQEQSDFSIKLNNDQLKNLEKKLLREYEDWNQILIDSYKEEPRLLMLNQRELSNLMIFLRCLQKYCLRYQQNFLISYVKLFFPEIVDQKLIKTNIIMELFETLKKNSIQESPNKNNEIKFIIAWIKKLFEHFNKSFNDQKSLEKEPEIIEISNSNLELLNLLIYLNDDNVPPHPSQIFWCNNELINEHDLNLFLKRCEQFPYMKFFIIHIEKLSMSLNEKLLNWISDLYIKKKQKSIGQLFLLFERSSIIESFSFLNKKNYKYDNNSDNFKEFRKNSKQGINQIFLVYDKNCVGKTFFIKKQLQKESRINFTITVAEDFSPSKFIDKLKKNLDNINANDVLAIHFNILEYAIFEKISKFFYNLLLWEIAWDESNGSLFSMMQDNSIIIYIEITEPSNNYNYIIDHLPIVTILSERKSVSIEWDLQKEEKLCLNFIEIYQKNMELFKNNTLDNLQKLLNLLSNNQISLNMEQFFNILTSYTHVSPLPLHRKMQIQLLYSRFMWLIEKDIPHRIDTFIQYEQGKKQHMMGIEQIRKKIDQFVSIDDLVQIFLKESSLLSHSNPTKHNLQTFLSCRQTNFFEGKYYTYINFFDFRREEEKLKSPSSSKIQEITLSSKNAIEKPSELRQQLALLFELEDTSKIGRLVDQLQYVLTPENAIKFITLYEKFQVNRAFIFSGDTGIGKTEALDFFSAIINCNSKMIPDIPVELYDEIYSKLFLDHEKPRFPSLRIERLSRDKITSDSVIELVNQLCGQTLPEEGNEIVDQPKNSFFETIISYLIPFIQNLLKKYILIKKTPLLKNVLNPDFKVDTKEKLLNLISDIMKVKFQKLFYKIMMHQKYSCKKFKKTMKKIFENIKNIQKEDNDNDNLKKLKFIIFIDEFNTAGDAMGTMKEIFVDGMLEGEQNIPENIFWVAAMNPLVINNEDYIDYTGVESKSKKSFIVRDPPNSMKNLIIEWENMNSIEQTNFITILFSMKKGIGSEEERENLKTFIEFGQNFLQRANQKRIHVSIRDIMRTIQLYEYFKFSKAGNSILYLYKQNNKLNEKQIHWLSLIISICMSYYFRIDSSKKDLKSNFEKEMNDLLEKKCFLKEFQKENFKNIVEKIMKGVWMQTAIPEGVACTNSLLQNLFSIIICVDCLIPLIIIGPPGCSKTLSFSIATDNMKSKSSHNEFYKNFPQLRPYRYQCTQHSTDTEIESKYEQAEKSQKNFNDLDPQNNQRMVVFLDEAGIY